MADRKESINLGMTNVFWLVCRSRQMFAADNLKDTYTFITVLTSVKRFKYDKIELKMPIKFQP